MLGTALQQYFHVKIFSHHVVLTKISPRGREILRSFAEQYIQYGLEKQGRFFIRKALRVFAASVLRGHEYRFHIEQWKALQLYLANMQILPHTYEVEGPVTTFNSAKTDIETLPHWVIRDYQEPIIQYLIDEHYKRKLLEIQTGRGKDQPLDAKIKVPGGWSTMGEMYVGKEITSITGGVQKVTGIFPQGVKQQYRVTFADGRSTECGAEHLWTVYYINTTPHKRWRVVNTMEMLRLISMPNPRVYVPLIESERCSSQILPVDPYLLGVLIGDGGLSTRAVNITKGNEQLFDFLKECLPDGLTLKRRDRNTRAIVRDEIKEHVLLTALSELDLIGKRSWEKFIPEVYLHGSHQQRLALLQGLMDTDGTANAIATGGAISYNSTSKQLAEQVQYLVRSLGGIASVSVRQTYFTYDGEKKPGRTSYDVNIRMKKPSEIFRLDAKKSRTNDDNQYAKDLKLRVVSIEPTRMVESQCISISSPEELYITDDFIVTHNTFSAVKAATLIGLRICVVLKPAFMDKWISDMKELCGLKRNKELEVIQGTPQLLKVLHLAKKGKFKADVVIISSRTLQQWYKTYEEHGPETARKKGYACEPGEFFQLLGIGIRIIDEVHLDFALHFKIDLYTHVEWSISLSATLVADDPFLNRMYELAYPKDKRFAGLAYNKYIHSSAWVYEIREPNRVRTVEWGSTAYSHHAFEKSIRRNPVLQKDYFMMVNYIMRELYLSGHKRGDRCLIYCASIEMATDLSSFLRNIHPSFDVRRYVEDDVYENLMQAEICVSTLLSAGTGHDIAGLTTVILTTNVSSSQSNIQGFGRLRQIQGREVKFGYLVCRDIPKHLLYHERKKELLMNMAQTYALRNYPNVLG